MRKRIIAWLLLGIMLVNFIPVQLLANAQKPLPIDGIRSLTVRNQRISALPGADIKPNINVEWLPALSNDPSVPPDALRDKAKAEAYRFELTDSTSTSATISGDRTAYPDAATYQDYLEARVKDAKFTNGKLYRLRVIPSHTETIQSGTGTQQVVVEPTGSSSQPAAYFLTDFNTKAKDVDGKLEVSWEYVPGGQYEIVYIPADKKTVREIENSVDNTGSQMTPARVPVDANYAKAAENQFIEDNVTKVKYTIAEAEPGQVYSIYVKLKGLSNDNPFGIRFDQVKQNESIDADGPKVAQSTTSINLKVFSVGANDIRLEWTLAAWLKLDPSKITQTLIKQRTQGSISEETIGTIPNQATAVEYYQYTRPTKNTYYFVEFIIEGQQEPLRTKEALYTPKGAPERPLQPQIPKPFSESIDTGEVNISEYKVSGDDINTNDPRFIEHTFHAKNEPSQIQLVWNIPKILNENNQAVIDYELSYDIYVVEDRNQLDTLGLSPIAENIFVGPNQRDQLIFKQDSTTVVGIKWLLDKYTKQDNTVTSLTPNKTYYIKIIAKREYAEDYIFSEPTIVTITVPQDGDIFTPPVLAKPPLKLHNTTTNTATLRWLTNWYEIAVKDAALKAQYNALGEGMYAENWNSVVYTGTDASPYIRFKKTEDLTEHILKTSNELQSVQNAVKGTTTYSALYIDREVTLGEDSQYELKVLGYDEVNRQIQAYNQTAGTPITIEQWLMQNESNTIAGWEDISPRAPQTDPENDQLPWLEYAKEGLEANTRYVILIRAYRVLADGTKLMQTFPSYVICTTLSDYESPEETPKTPELYLDTKDDTSITVWWTYNSNFDYEIVYGRLDDPGTATPWDFTISNVPGEDNYVSDGAKASVKITGLMPETTYNVWIRAKQKIGDKVSAWSNPVTVTTDMLGIPAMPTGLGPAAYQSILEAGKDFPPVGKDYITVEWIKNSNDKEENEDDNLEKQYSYVVEFADNPEFLDAVVVNTTDGADGGEGAAYEILSKNMIRFNKLIANRPYYVKVKTVLKFSDKDGKREIIKESEYTKWVRILTKKSSDEYDGGDNDNIVIYPNPIVEDYTKDVWTIEIVDTAKIISDIMKQNAYFFTIKAEKYNNRYDAEIRRIKIPKAVIDTLINRNMELRVVTSTGTYELPVKALASYTKQYNAKDTVQFDFKRVIDYKIASIIRLYPETLLKGEQLDIVIRGKSTTLPIKQLDGYLKVKLKLEAKTEYLYKNIFAYTYNFDKASWTKETYSIDTLTDTSISYLTSVTGIYSIYEKKDIAPTSLSTYAMRDLASTYDMAALGTIYFQNDAVYRDQFVHLMLGVAQNKSQIDLTAPAYADSLTKARSAGIYISSSSGQVNEEQAIAGIVKLYELKNGYKIKPSTVRLNGVSRDYQEAVSKAYALGLIEEINPTRPITYGVLCDWILQVTQ